MRTRRVTVAALLGSCGFILGTSSAFASCSPCGPTPFQQSLGYIAKEATQFGVNGGNKNLQEIRDRLWYDQHVTPAYGPPVPFAADRNKIDPSLLADTNFDPNLLAY